MVVEKFPSFNDIVTLVGGWLARKAEACLYISYIHSLSACIKSEGECMSYAV